MKRLLYLIIIVATSVLLSACNKTPAEPVLPDPPTKALAKVISFAEPVGISGHYFDAIELTESGRYIAKLLDENTKAFDNGSNVIVGHYEYINNEYILEDLCVIGLQQNVATVTPMGGEPVVVSVAVVPNTTTSTLTSNASRNWKIKHFFVSVVGPDSMGGEKRFDGMDLEEIVTYVKGWGVDISDDDMERVEGYVVDELIITGANSFVISFTNGKAYYGSWELTQENFSYAFSEGDIPVLLSGSANGTLSFPSETEALLVGEGSVTTTTEKEYTVGLEFELEESL